MKLSKFEAWEMEVCLIFADSNQILPGLPKVCKKRGRPPLIAIFLGTEIRPSGKGTADSRPRYRDLLAGKGIVASDFPSIANFGSGQPNPGFDESVYRLKSSW